MKQKDAIRFSITAWSFSLGVGICILFDVIPFEYYGNVLILLNTVLFILGMLAFWNGWTQRDSSEQKNTWMIVSILISMAAFVFNIDFFGFSIHSIKDIIQNGWHNAWLLYDATQIVILSGVAKSLWNLLVSLLRYSCTCIKNVYLWLESTVKASPKGALFAVLLGLIVWGPFLNLTVSNRTVDQFFYISMLFWGGWIVLCTLISLFFAVIPRLKRATDTVKDEDLLQSVSTGILFVGGLIFAVCIFIWVHGALGFAFSAALLIALIIWKASRTARKQKVRAYFEQIGINPLDFYFFLFVILITALCILFLGADQKSELNSISDITQWLDFFTAGLELIQSLG